MDRRRAGRRGIRIGPMIFVPELLVTSSQDPWAHRKGEPRMLVLFWSVYLVISALLTIFATRQIGLPSPAIYAQGARTMLVMTGLGLCVLWPMARLSQMAPERPEVDALGDLAALLLPVQAVIWPMPFLTGWSWTVTAALVALMASWGALSSGIVAMSLERATTGTRLAGTAVCIMCVAGAPLIGWFIQVFHLPYSPPLLAMLSPITAPYALTTAPAGPKPTSAQWLATAAPAVAGAVLLLCAYGRRRWRAATPTGP